MALQVLRGRAAVMEVFSPKGEDGRSIDKSHWLACNGSDGKAIDRNS